MAKRTKTPKTIRQFFIDDEGRDKVITEATDKRIALFLMLRSDKRKRKIGVITISTKTMEVKRDRHKHLFKRGSAYGFNEYVLKTTKKFDTIRLSDEYDDWKIPVRFIMENGRYLHFQGQGYELQKFVSLEQIEQFKVQPKTNARI